MIILIWAIGLASAFALGVAAGMRTEQHRTVRFLVALRTDRRNRNGDYAGQVELAGIDAVCRAYGER